LRSFHRQANAQDPPGHVTQVQYGTGALINNTGFLRAERNLLESRGWTYDPATTMWYPPAGL